MPTALERMRNRIRFSQRMTAQNGQLSFIFACKAIRSHGDFAALRP